MCGYCGSDVLVNCGFAGGGAQCRVLHPSGQRIDGVEQSKRGGVFVCDMGRTRARQSGETSDGGSGGRYGGECAGQGLVLARDAKGYRPEKAQECASGSSGILLDELVGELLETLDDFTTSEFHSNSALTVN